MFNSKRSRSMAIAVLLMLGIIVTPSVEANDPLALSVNNSKLLKSQIKENDEDHYLTQIMNTIREQGEQEQYYFEGLNYKFVDLDKDGTSEIMASIDSGVNLGSFFILSINDDGEYKLLFEAPWKVESLELGRPIKVGDAILYETIEHTGGTGIQVEIAHLWHFTNGQVVEAWHGTVKELNAMFPGEYFLSVGSYRIIDQKLYVWTTDSLLEDDLETLREEPVTALTIYQFDGSVFKQQ